jgi:hypothetical protein
MLLSHCQTEFKALTKELVEQQCIHCEKGLVYGYNS